MGVSSKLGFVVLLCACSSTLNRGNDDTETSPTQGYDSGVDDSEDTANEPDAGPAYWFGVRGDIALSNRQAEVRIDWMFYPEDASGEVLCTTESSEKSIVLQANSPDPSIPHWWSIERPTSGTCSADILRLPPFIQVGLGSIHESILPHLATDGIENPTPSEGFFGSYIGFNESESSETLPGTAFVLGYAKHQQPTPQDSERPPDSGAFSLEGVFLFPLQSTEGDTGEDASQ